ncbi:lysophospholipase [Nitrosomonas sp. ANs5]|uniref:alpha/beta hydrolase n=1 Tax=Nitrosomonas sp. ANs5 TaxID=3423941 RepID=UPI003D336E9E
MAGYKQILIVFFSIWMLGCTPTIHKPGNAIMEPRLLDDRYITPDGTQLPLRYWSPEQDEPEAVLIALHGFNDYSQFFEAPGKFLKDHGIVSYAYDQRGFGASASRGLWSGIDAYAEDLNQFIDLVRSEHRGLPVYLLGESMGGAVAIAAMARNQTTAVDGLILAAPAVWARETMPWYQRTLLWLLAHTIPWMTLTGQGLGVVASDNIDMLIELGRDPLVIKATRVEAIHGLTNLMDEASSNARNIPVNTLMLYGEKDEIIPPKPMYRFLREFADHNAAAKTIALYENGYHMLLRDLQAKVIWQDIYTWIKSSNTAALPSGADRRW